MRLSPIVVLAISCGTLVAVEGEAPDPTTPAQIVIESTGGIASLRVRLRLDSLNGVVTREVCGLGVPVVDCGIRGNRESVTIAKAEVARLFGLTVTAEFRALRADYGRSTQGADLMDHIVSITANARTRSISADDITRPDPLANLIGEVSKALQR